jgi:hypothetical protein
MGLGEMAGSRTGPAAQTDRGVSTPAKARLAILGGVAAALAGAVYLLAVRGEALLLDLSALAGRVWCF